MPATATAPSTPTIAFITVMNEFSSFTLKNVGDRVSFGDFDAFTTFLSELIGDHPDAYK